MKKTRFIFENNQTPRAGGFLLSDPFMGDAYFERSVVYLCQYDTDGVFGFVLNNALHLNLSDFMNNCPFGDYPLFVGGPVAKNQLFFLHNLGFEIAHSLPCGEEVYFSGDFDSLVEFSKNHEKKALKLKFFVGYSGWDQGQLEQEIENHSWIAVDNLSQDFVFTSDTKDFWKTCMDAQGSKFKIIARFPKNPNDN